MELRDLDQDERTALVGLMKVVVMADRDVSDGELEHVASLVDAFGKDGYQRALETFEARSRDEGSFRRFLSGIGRQEARELIFAALLESAAEGAVDAPEAEILDWLSTAWNVKIEIAPDDAG
jgi:hypothetical protein